MRRHVERPAERPIAQFAQSAAILLLGVLVAALAQDTGMCFDDAELLRLRAHTHTDPDARQADIAAALELARRQGVTLFELRAALDDYELLGQPARAALIDAASRIPANNAWPELARAQASLSEHSPRDRSCRHALTHADPLKE
jgi:hypothetical protein